jgi:catechol 2,3-dioxygenase-like lactoylglutathione lyase family enzyme
MAVLGLIGYAIEVPDLSVGATFYTQAGLEAAYEADRVRLFCQSGERPSITLLKTSGPMRLHHVQLRADALDEVALLVPGHGGSLVSAPAGFEPEGIWVKDPHGVLFQLVAVDQEPEILVDPPFAINAPGRIVRTRRSAMLPVASYPPVQPRRLGHVAMFTPDVLASVAFVTEAFGMGLADRAQDIVAFCCARRNSDHHVLAFAKSPGTGIHHASFQVADPDEVGRAGHALAEKVGKGHWGFGRHTIGSNFFNYIQDPWGSWFEYYSDMDFIDDYALWQPTNYGLEDAMANWGPPVPSDFVHNYQAEELA